MGPAHLLLWEAAVEEVEPSPPLAPESVQYLSSHAAWGTKLGMPEGAGDPLGFPTLTHPHSCKSRLETQLAILYVLTWERSSP